jgi:hypothetical protein
MVDKLAFIVMKNAHTCLAHKAKQLPYHVNSISNYNCWIDHASNLIILFFSLFSKIQNLLNEAAWQCWLAIMETLPT